MDIYQKLEILTDSAKYDVACTSSGVARGPKKDGIGNTNICGICHSFAGDGRCISLLKILMTNYCVYDCKYCVNRKSNDVPRAAFTPRELADLTLEFYKRNYIEGLFLSSGVLKNPDYTAELMIRSLRIIREEYRFNGYIHAKAIPGTSDELLYQLGLLCDRMSANIEMPSYKSLHLLAPDKSRNSVLEPMQFVCSQTQANKQEIVRYKNAPKFVPAGQSTQMMVGASPESDLQILNLTEGLYHKYQLKRVFFSAYIPVVENSLLPAINSKPQLLREHRLYQADWLLRFYHFTAKEILDDEHPNFHPFLDPKCSWALRHLDCFPVEINKADYETLLRVPGIGVRTARRILYTRRTGAITIDGLKKLGVVMKRAKYFVMCGGKMEKNVRMDPEEMICSMMSKKMMLQYKSTGYSHNGNRQLSFFAPDPEIGEAIKCLTGEL